MNFDEILRSVAEGLDNVRWRSCQGYGAPDDTYEWYYAEGRLYVIRSRKMKGYHFVYGKSPEDAFERLRQRFLNQNKR